MFNIDENPVFTHDVIVRVPVDGGYRNEVIKATYEVIPTDEAARFDLSTEAGARAFLRRVVKKLDELVDRNRNAVPYNDEVRERVLSLPHARQALAAAYFKALEGAKLGN
jgi:hypothetical protein